MTIHNTLRLTRNLRRIIDKVIVYEKYVSSFKEIFKLHPLESSKNETYFKSLQLTVQEWGDGSILILNSAYTFGLLEKISKNSLKDAGTFYEVSKKTVLQFNGMNLESAHSWYKTALSAIWLAHPFENIETDEKINYWSQLNDKQKENAQKMCIEKFGLKGYEELSLKSGKEIEKIDNLDEKIVCWMIQGSVHLENAIKCKVSNFTKVINNQMENNNFKFNYKIITKLIDKRLLNFHEIGYAKKIMDISKIEIPVDSYSNLKGYALDTELKKQTNLKEIFEIFYVQNLFHKFKVKNDNILSFDFIKYNNIKQLIDKIDFNNLFVVKSMEKFILNETRENAGKNEKTGNLILNFSLELNLKEKTKHHKSIKI